MSMVVLGTHLMLAQQASDATSPGLTGRVQLFQPCRMLTSSGRSAPRTVRGGGALAHWSRCPKDDGGPRRGRRRRAPGATRRKCAIPSPHQMAYASRRGSPQACPANQVGASAALQGHSGAVAVRQGPAQATEIPSCGGSMATRARPAWLLESRPPSYSLSHGRSTAAAYSSSLRCPSDSRWSSPQSFDLSCRLCRGPCAPWICRSDE